MTQILKYALVILKPDCLQRNLAEKIFKILSDNGFNIVFKKQMRLRKKDVKFIYRACCSEDWFNDFINFMISDDSMIVLLSCRTDNVVKMLDELVGPTDPQKASSHHIRKLGENIRRNLIHSASDEKSFRQEINYFFKKIKLRA